MQRRWLYHPEHGGVIFEGGDIDRKRAEGWYDSPKLFPPAPPPSAETEAPKRGPGRPKKAAD